MSNSERKIINIEEAVLGYLLLNNSNSDLYMALLSRDDFVSPQNQEIFAALLELFDENKKFEDALIVHILEKNKKFDFIGGEAKLLYLKSKAGLKSNITPMIQMMEEYSKRRKTAKAITEISQELTKDKTADAILDSFEQKLLEITKGTTSKEFDRVDKISEELVKELEERRKNPHVLKGIETSFRDLDEYTSGLQKGDLIILAARPSMGKTAFALNLAFNVAENPDSTVVVFSLEMPSTQLVTRMLSMKSSVSGNHLKEPTRLQTSEMIKIRNTQERLSKMKMYIDDQAGVTLSEIRWKVERLQKQLKNVKLVVIDYLQLITVAHESSDNRQLEVSKISRTLKKLAREIDCPILALSQLSRSVEKREDKMPILSDLRESGAIEQDADLIFFLYREQYYSKDREQNSASGKQDVIVNIAKHRNGPTGKFALDFDPSIGLFSDQAFTEQNKYNKGDD